MNLWTTNRKSRKGELDEKGVFLSAIMLAVVMLLVLSSVRSVSSREQTSETDQILLIVRPLVMMNHSKVQN